MKSGSSLSVGSATPLGLESAAMDLLELRECLVRREAVHLELLLGLEQCQGGARALAISAVRRPDLVTEVVKARLNAREVVVLDVADRVQVSEVHAHDVAGQDQRGSDLVREDALLEESAPIRGPRDLARP